MKFTYLIVNTHWGKKAQMQSLRVAHFKKTHVCTSKAHIDT